MHTVSSTSKEDQDQCVIIESSVGGLGLKPLHSIQHDNTWHVMGHYCRTPHLYPETTCKDIYKSPQQTHITVLDNHGTQLGPICMVTHPQRTRMLESGDICQIANTRQVSAGDSSNHFGSMAQDSRFANALIEWAPFGQVTSPASAKLLVQHNTDSAAEIFVRYINDDKDNTSMQFSRSYPPSDREIRLFCEWIESSAFTFSEDLKPYEKYSSNPLQPFIRRASNASPLHSQSVFNSLYTAILVHSRVRVLVQDTIFRLYLENLYKDNKDILEKLTKLDKNTIWQPYYIHDKKYVDRLRSLPNFTNLLTQKSWSTIRKKTIQIRFVVQDNLAGQLKQHIQTIENHPDLNPREKSFALNLFKKRPCYTAHESAKKIKENLSQAEGFFAGSYEEISTIMNINNIISRLSILDPYYSTSDSNIDKMIHYICALRDDIHASLANRYQYDAYSPKLIDILSFKIRRILENLDNKRKTMQLNLLLQGLQKTKEKMHEKNYKTHPICQKIYDAIALQCLYDYESSHIIFSSLVLESTPISIEKKPTEIDTEGMVALKASI